MAHPPGYPSFVLLGQLFGRVLSGDPAHRITVMSGFIGACAVALLFLFLAAALGLSLVAAVGASAILALSFTFWWSAIGPEVYTLATLFFLLALWRTVLALREPSVRRYVLAGLCLGLTLTGHFTFGPPALALFLILVFSALRAGPLRSGPDSRPLWRRFEPDLHR